VIRVNVERGTNAGVKLPLREPVRDPWTCQKCERVNQGFIVRCLGPNCNEPRPS
jgi:hypothetical protein